MSQSLSGEGDTKELSAFFFTENARLFEINGGLYFPGQSRAEMRHVMQNTRNLGAMPAWSPADMNEFLDGVEEELANATTEFEMKLGVPCPGVPFFLKDRSIGGKINLADIRMEWVWFCIEYTRYTLIDSVDFVQTSQPRFGHNASEYVPMLRSWTNDVQLPIVFYSQDTKDYEYVTIGMLLDKKIKKTCTMEA